MQYRFAGDVVASADLSSGRVFEGASGHPAFPVRLASEVLQRCLAIRDGRDESHSSEPLTVYDPCCGGAYLLGTVAYLHGERIGRLIASDVDEGILPLANRNLGLLTVEGIEARIARLEELERRFGKESHRRALESAARMRGRVGALRRTADLAIRLFAADALDSDSLEPHLRTERIDLVITDVPYGSGSAWRVPASMRTPPIQAMLDALHRFLTPRSIVAVSADKSQEIRHDAYRRLERFQIGKRRVAILGPL